MRVQYSDINKMDNPQNHWNKFYKQHDETIF